MNKGLLALAIGGFGIGLTEFVIMGILPEVATAFDISIPKAGHFISAYALGVVVGAPILTTIGNKWAANRVLLALMLWFTVFNTLSAFATGYNSFIVLRFLSGLPHGAFFGIGAVVAGKLSKVGKSAQGIAIMFSGLTFANLLGVPLGTYLGKHFSWNLSFLLVGFVGILVVLSIKFWMPLLKQSSETHILDDLKNFLSV
ncbi:MFS transporter [Formosa algae]|uniref:MFS transporter n=1 Tax=Formosa algae TaxID=225843 RepID=UPI002683DDA5|nr:MFS transporter [Formosa algae]